MSIKKQSGQVSPAASPMVYQPELVNNNNVGEFTTTFAHFIGIFQDWEIKFLSVQFKKHIAHFPQVKQPFKVNHLPEMETGIVLALLHAVGTVPGVPVGDLGTTAASCMHSKLMQAVKGE